MPTYQYCLVSEIWEQEHIKVYDSIQKLEDQMNWLTTQTPKYQEHYKILAIYRLMRPMTYEKYLENKKKN